MTRLSTLPVPLARPGGPGQRTTTRASLAGLCWALLALLGLPLTAAEPLRLFNGQTLAGWDGDARFWRVEDGCISGETRPDQVLTRNTFLIWRGGVFADGTIELDYRFLSDEGNSGLQYRSSDLGDHLVSGYQANIEQGGKNRNGMNYSEGTGREVLALAGERAWVGDGRTRIRTEHFAEAKDLFTVVKGRGEWNHYQLVAHGNTMTIAINGTLMSQTVDESATQAAKEGIIALQLHVGKAMKIQFKDVVLIPLVP